MEFAKLTQNDLQIALNDLDSHPAANNTSISTSQLTVCAISHIIKFLVSQQKIRGEPVKIPSTGNLKTIIGSAMHSGLFTYLVYAYLKRQNLQIIDEDSKIIYTPDEIEGYAIFEETVSVTDSVDTKHGRADLVIYNMQWLPIKIIDFKTTWLLWEKEDGSPGNGAYYNPLSYERQLGIYQKQFATKHNIEPNSISTAIAWFSFAQFMQDGEPDDDEEYTCFSLTPATSNPGNVYAWHATFKRKIRKLSDAKLSEITVSMDRREGHKCVHCNAVHFCPYAKEVMTKIDLTTFVRSVKAAKKADFSKWNLEQLLTMMKKHKMIVYNKSLKLWEAQSPYDWTSDNVDIWNGHNIEDNLYLLEQIYA